MSGRTTLAPPKGVGAAARKLWRAVLDDWDLDAHEVTLLTELVRAVDRLEQLDELIREHGVLVDGLHGKRANPALVEARQLQIVAARISAVLRLPDGEEGSESPGRRQRRAGARGTYRMRAVG